MWEVSLQIKEHAGWHAECLQGRGSLAKCHIALASASGQVKGTGQLLEGRILSAIAPELCIMALSKTWKIQEAEAGANGTKKGRFAEIVGGERRVVGNGRSLRAALALASQRGYQSVATRLWLSEAVVLWDQFGSSHKRHRLPVI